MDKEFTDSPFPWGIGTSFVAILIAMLAIGAITGFIVGNRNDFPQAGGVFLLIVFLVLMVGPVFFTLRKSRFEQGRIPIARFDGLGTLAGLRGVYIRMLLYEDGLEIRAFYHRHFIPFQRIKSVSVEKVFLSKKLIIHTDIDGIPGFVAAADKRFADLAHAIENKVNSR